MGASSTVSLAEGTHPEIVGPLWIEVALPGLSGKHARLELSGNSTENGEAFRGQGGEPKGWSEQGREPPSQAIFREVTSD
jgi:hypothetical protein